MPKGIADEAEMAELRLHWLRRALKTVEEEHARLVTKLALNERDLKRIEGKIADLEKVAQRNG